MLREFLPTEGALGALGSDTDHVLLLQVVNQGLSLRDTGCATVRHSVSQHRMMGGNGKYRWSTCPSRDGCLADLVVPEDVDVAGDVSELGSGEKTKVPDTEDQLTALVHRGDREGVVMRPKGCAGAPGSRSQEALNQVGPSGEGPAGREEGYRWTGPAVAGSVEPGAKWRDIVEPLAHRNSVRAQVWSKSAGGHGRGTRTTTREAPCADLAPSSRWSRPGQVEARGRRASPQAEKSEKMQAHQPPGRSGAEAGRRFREAEWSGRAVEWVQGQWLVPSQVMAHTPR